MMTEITFAGIQALYGPAEGYEGKVFPFETSSHGSFRRRRRRRTSAVGAGVDPVRRSWSGRRSGGPPEVLRTDVESGLHHGIDQYYVQTEFNFSELNMNQNTRYYYSLSLYSQVKGRAEQ